MPTPLTRSITALFRHESEFPVQCAELWDDSREKPAKDDNPFRIGFVNLEVMKLCNLKRGTTFTNLPFKTIAIIVCIPGLIIIPTTIHAQASTDTMLAKILRSNNNPVFREVLDNPHTYRLQIIYTVIDRDKANKPVLKNYYFHFDPDLYFNPASMVKMPVAFLSLEKLHSIRQNDVDKYTTVLFDSSQPWHQPLHQDISSVDSLPSIAHFIKRAMLISENDPYNRMYQFLGQGAINITLHSKGYKDIRIIRQFLGLTASQNRATNGIRFIGKNGQLLHSQPPLVNKDTIVSNKIVRLGKAYYNRNDSLINEPFDFTEHNSISLKSMQQMLQSVLFPMSVPTAQRFRLTADDYDFLKRYLSQFPSETPYPKYDTSKFYDSFLKFFFRDSTRKLPDHIRVFNKVGWAYGFLTDVSYVADFKNRIEYMLSATLYVNKDEILNDDKYEYLSTGHPFLYQLGQTIYQYELKRKRTHPPDLSEFRIRYENRDPHDKRPPISQADN